MAFITKLNPTGSALVYSTFLGGDGGNNEGRGIAVDGFGRACVVGSTSAADFPVTPDAIQPIYAGNQDVFVTVMNESGSALFFSTFLGGTGPGIDVGRRIVIDETGSLYVTGLTESDDFPVTSRAFQPIFGGSGDAFITKIQFAASFTTGVLQNTTAAGPAASSVLLLVSNDSPVDPATIRIAAFFVSGTSRIPFVSELTSVPPGSTLTRSYSVQPFQAFEIQYALAGPGFGDTVVSVFPVDGLGNPRSALRVLQAEATPIFMLSPTL